MKNTFRQGSALLIVLGMLSFMVISAIGFAVYMRQNRLPSSFVRRNTSSHQLLQAALARAMNELDSAIGEDQFPGVSNNGASATSNPVKGGENARFIDDSWLGRVFMGALTNMQITVSSRTNLLASTDSTVSTLTLEGLAYLPPALVNDARYFTKRSPTAQWRTLAYDAGRYAYSAINVSDYFDINSVGATARFGTPSNRVSIAYLFTDKNGVFDSNAAKKFEQFRKNTLSSDKEMVSIADYNLRLGNSSFDSSFVDFVNGENGSNYTKFYGNGDTNFIARSLFVTDSYQGEKVVTNAANKVDLAKKEHQPFDGKLMNGNSSKQLNMKEIFLDNSYFAKAIKDLGLNGGTFEREAHMALCDYLDENSIPSSLAIPTTERVPMIAGVEVVNAEDMSYEIERKTGEWDDSNYNPTTDKGPQKTDLTVTRKVTYSLKSLQVPNQFHVRALPVYPFKYHPDLDDTFEVDAMMNVFLGIGNFGMRGGSATEGNVDLVSSDLYVDMAGKDVSGKTAVHADTLRLTCASEGKPKVKLPSAILKEEDAITDALDLSFETPSIPGDALPILTTTETWKWTAANGQWKFVNETVKEDEKHASPISGGATGFSVRSAYKGNYEALKTAEIKPYLAIRLRVKLGNKTVDLVPASYGDDTPLNGLSDCGDDWLKISRSAGELACPVLLFAGPNLEKNPFSLEALNNSDDCLFGKVHDRGDSTKQAKVAFNIKNKTVYCADPRYNHAPENWVAGTGGLTKNGYLAVARTAMSHKGGEKDIFMTVSDQGYLQSISELAMLPRIQKLTSGGQNSLLTKINSNQNDFPAADQAQDQKCFFRSLPLTKDFADSEDEFSICRDSEDDEDCLEYAFIEDMSGFRINPYSDDPEVLKGAFVLTPYDWRAAGTNGVSDLSSPDNFDKAFCATPDDKAAKIDDKKLNEMIEEFVESMRDARDNGTKNDWISVFNSLDWQLGGTSGSLSAGQEDSTLFGADLGVNLHSIDRKYLYGFWRDCFAVNQQLFIIFLRAEPTILGGGSGKGATRAQLGGRAVAVVWRDPSSPKVESSGSKNQNRKKAASWMDPPHRMRVLFYKTLE